MKNTIFVPVTAVLGAVIGFLLYYYLKFSPDNYGDAWGILGNYWADYFSIKGMHYSVISKIIISTVGGGYILSLVAIFIISRITNRGLAQQYKSLDMSAKYIVYQRKRDTFLISLLCLFLGVLVFYAFSSIHSFREISVGKEYSTVGFPYLAFVATVSLLVLFLAISLLSFYAVLTHGHFAKLPIIIKNNEVHFYKSYYGLPIAAIDRPVFASLEDSDIDFKSQGGKGYLVIANEIDRVVISPKLEFAEGSFDELVDYIEQFVVEDNEGEA